MMENFTPEEIRVMGKLTREELAQRRLRAVSVEEGARHERQLIDWELRRRWMEAPEEAER